MTSGVLHIAAITDLLFASFLPGAAAGMGYSYLLASAPLGVLSTSLILTFMPTFVNNREPRNWITLRRRVCDVVLFSYSLIE